jgi:hypothetical protein
MNATLSPCGQYRYMLSREWADGPRLAFIMLNPSIADAELDDPTIRRCIRFGRDSGYGGILVGNLFAWRATDATELKITAAPVGPDNDAALAHIITTSPIIVCAWGNGGTFLGRDRKVLNMVRAYRKKPHCLQMTKQGNPSHPLYLRAALRPIEMLLPAPSKG